MKWRKVKIYNHIDSIVLIMKNSKNSIHQDKRQEGSTPKRWMKGL